MGGFSSERGFVTMALVICKDNESIEEELLVTKREFTLDDTLKSLSLDASKP